MKLALVSLFVALFVAISLAAHAQTPAEIERVANEIVPEQFRPLALTDQVAMIDAWVAHDVGLIRQRMIDSGSDPETVTELLEGATNEFRETIETDWYGRLESLPNRDPQFSDLTDREVLDQANAAGAAGQYCDQADLLAEFHGRNTRARAGMLSTAEAARQLCGDG